MQEFSGDGAIWIMISICCGAIVFGWLLLALSGIAMMLYPKQQVKIDGYWDVLFTPLSWLQKYAFIAGISITFFRVMLSWLDMAPPFFPQ